MSDPVSRAAGILREGGRLSEADALALLESHDLLGLGRLALAAKRAASGDSVYYAPNVHVNPTNVCRLRCPICAFSRDEGDGDAYLLDPEAVAHALARLRDERIVEAHLVGGVSPKADLAYTLDLLRRIKAARPDLVLQGLTAVEVDAFARANGLSLRETLERLMAAGLDALPGGGAEIFAPRVRAIVAPKKISGERWLEVMREAHALGLPTNATMLYGHVETLAERIDHLARLRALQDETGGFRCFVPLAFHAANTAFPDLPPTTGFDDLKTFAVSRLFLDNVPHVKGLWMYMGLEFAQVALHFGVDDMGGTGRNERIVHAAGARTPAEVGELRLRRIIEAAGFRAVAVDSAYLREHPFPGGEAA